jgi:2,4-dienoyl-CoA reductase-like NADH-dependent reductase (Old Yellow Enzyme family)
LAYDSLFQPLAFQHGEPMKNRFMLAPMTNNQSRPDGVLSEEEIHWLTLRAKGGFGLVMTAASHVQPVGQGFAGQLGCFSDAHIPGLTRLADQIRAHGALSSVQLHHAGIRSPKDLVGQPVGPSDDEETGSRGLTLAEVEQLRDDFVAAAVRAEKAGFDGAEIHGAHGYILTAFLSPETNRREDRYGGSLENRARLTFEVIDAIRAATGPKFQLGLRLSPERFGLRLAEVIETATKVLTEGKVDYLDMSLWDVKKEPNEEAFQGRSLASYFAELPRGRVALGAAGAILTPSDALELREAGFDFATIGKSAILNHDFPNRLRADAAYAPAQTPVSPEHLAREGVSPPFLATLRRRPNFVEETAPAAE